MPSSNDSKIYIFVKDNRGACGLLITGSSFNNVLYSSTIGDLLDPIDNKPLDA